MTFKFETQSIRIGMVPSPSPDERARRGKILRSARNHFFHDPPRASRERRLETSQKRTKTRFTPRYLRHRFVLVILQVKVRKSNGTLARWRHWTTTRQAIVFSIFCEESLACDTNPDCSEMHSGSCIQMTSSCKCTILTQLNECAPRRFVISGDGIFSPHLVIIVSLRMTDFSISWIIFSCCLISWE